MTRKEWRLAWYLLMRGEWRAVLREARTRCMLWLRWRAAQVRYRWGTR